jgi:hypothetical protein
MAISKSNDPLVLQLSLLIDQELGGLPRTWGKKPGRYEAE